MIKGFDKALESGTQAGAELVPLGEAWPAQSGAEVCSSDARRKNASGLSAALVRARDFYPGGKAAAWVLFLCTLAASGRARAADYYVSPGGNDANPGTAANPWRSLSKVNAAGLAPGDNVLFEGGQRFEGNLVLDERVRANPQRPITLGSFDHGRAVIDAGLGTGILIRNIGGVIIRDLIVIGDDASKNQGFGVMALNERGAAKLDFIRIENVEVSGFRWSGIYVGGAPTLLPGFNALPGSRFGFRNVEIAHATVHDNLYCGIFVSGPWNRVPGGYANEDVTIRDCVVHDNLGDPTYKKHHSGNGILVDDTDGGLIERSAAYHNGGANGSKGGPVGIWADNSNRITIQFSESYANHTGGKKDGAGFDLDGGVSNSVLQYNYSHDNDGPGFLTWNYVYAVHPLVHNVIRYNLSENDGRQHHCGGIEVGTGGQAVQHIEVYNNTVLITKNGQIVPSAVWVTGSGDNQDIHFRNNLLMTDGEAPLVEIDKNQTGVSLQGNAYSTQGERFLVLYAGTEYHDVATWRAQSGQEILNGKAVGVFVDSHLSPIGMSEVLAGSGRLPPLRNYHLLPGSPLIDAGLDLRAEFGIDVGRHDVSGMPIPQGRAFDIGAIEAPGEMERRGAASQGKRPETRANPTNGRR